VARNAEVDQIDMSIRCAHDIGWFEIAKDDRGVLMMQIVQHTTQLRPNRYDFVQQKFPFLLASKIVFERFTLNKAHD
jgi:hypothetical protein